MKRIYVILVCIICTTLCLAQSVSKSLATEIAFRYINSQKCESAPKIMTSNRTNGNAIDTTYTRKISLTGKAPLYLIQMDEGWVLVSSELAATPILASAQTGNFPSFENMPDGMKWLLSYYERSMEYARDSLPKSLIDSCWAEHIQNNGNATFYTTIDNERLSENVLTRMALVHWGQSYNNGFSCVNPYNKYCPDWYAPACGRTVVGCTAVAMGQVMWFWQWPYSAVIPDSINKSGVVSSEEHLVKYNWSNMPTDLYSSTDTNKVNSVAGFLRDCGYASKMKYMETASGASFSNAKNAIENRFHYKTVKHRYRNFFIGNWTNKLKSEIDAGRPVIYAGYNDTVGHAFVVFGYDADNKFNINWGYLGIDNYGTYSLDALNPRTILNGPYNDDQEALWEIEPDYPDCNTHVVQNECNDVNFEIYNGDTIIAVNKTISEYKSGVIYSERGVFLLPPFRIRQGANVSIGIRNMNCNLSRADFVDYLQVNAVNATDDDMNTESFNCKDFIITNDVLKVEVLEGISVISIYNCNGQCILRTTATEINISQLPEGLYLLQAQTTDGKLLQGKFIHSR